MIKPGTIDVEPPYTTDTTGGEANTSESRTSSSNPSFGSISVGSGSTAFKADESGVWLGSNTYADAPFKIDMSGNVTMSKGQIQDSTTNTFFNVTDGLLQISDENNIRIQLGKLT